MVSPYSWDEHESCVTAEEDLGESQNGKVLHFGGRPVMDKDGIRDRHGGGSTNLKEIHMKKCQTHFCVFLF